MLDSVRRWLRAGGAWVSEIYSTGVLSPGVPVNITVWSYVDQLGVAVLTDDQTFAESTPRLRC